MFDGVLSLRFFLLVIGVAIVIGVYLWGASKARHNARLKYESRRTRFEPRKRREPVAGQTVVPTLDVRVDEASATSVVFSDEVIVDDPEPVELPTVTRETSRAPQTAPETEEKEEGQLELGFDNDGTTAAVESPQVLSEKIITLYVKPPAGHEFAGPSIVRAMNGLGLRFGDMDIFHHYGAGELRSESPLFSVANMVEPGYFDLANIERFFTPGLAMFLRLPAPLEGAIAFELFLNTAQRLAEALSGDLYGEPKKLLDGAMIDNMRRAATPFADNA